mgnify:CR=1 FL=1
MDTDDIVSNLVSLLEQIRCMLTERLRNFSNEALNLIRQQKGLKLNRREILEIILKSLKGISGEMILELIRNSSLNDNDKCLLNVLYGNPRVAILSPIKTTEEEVCGGELLISDKTLARYKTSEHLPAQEDTPEDIDRYFLH